MFPDGSAASPPFIFKLRILCGSHAVNITVGKGAVIKQDIVRKHTFFAEAELFGKPLSLDMIGIYRKSDLVVAQSFKAIGASISQVVR